MSQRSVLRRTGGLVYHARAWRAERRGLWKEFQAELERWLLAWNPKSRRLLLVGPSGGYCLPASFLSRFAAISAVDLDPLAPRFFRRRHPEIHGRIPIDWRIQDGLGLQALQPLLSNPAPHTAVLFCNLLGQVRFEFAAQGIDPADSPADFQRWTAAFREQLKRLPEWASFHDRWSGNFAPLQARTDFDGAAAPDVQWVQSQAPLAPQAPLVLLDHLTGRVFEGVSHSRCALLRWELSPRSYHWIEALEGGAQK